LLREPHPLEHDIDPKPMAASVACAASPSG
jgi:hypothetical protein